MSILLSEIINSFSFLQLFLLILSKIKNGFSYGGSAFGILSLNGDNSPKINLFLYLYLNI